jgi:thioredoxin-dependent peroxiredoxin
VRDEIEQFRDAGVQPFGVNPAGVDAHRRYVEKFHFTFPLLSDAGREAARAYGALKPDGKGIVRTVVLVRRDGRVQFAERGAPPAERILRGVQPRPGTR